MGLEIYCQPVRQVDVVVPVLFTVVTLSVVYIPVLSSSTSIGIQGDSLVINIRDAILVKIQAA